MKGFSRLNQTAAVRKGEGKEEGRSRLKGEKEEGREDHKRPRPQEEWGGGGREAILWGGGEGGVFSSSK